MSDRRNKTPTLLDLIEECLEGFETKGMRALEEICALHPELETELRRRFERLSRLGLLDLIATEPAGGVPEQLGEFRLLRRLGGGGMGVVYLAEQESLGRRVALKLLRSESVFFDKARKRFEREVETVAQLQHPGIVPVHAMGESDGIPWFAMEFIHGCSLADVLKRLQGRPLENLRGADLAQVIRAHLRESGEDPTETGETELFGGSWVETCLRITHRIAETLSHAHGEGVLHRDVKPSNIMVTLDGRVMLVDFGLAKRPEASRLTRTGALVGSLPYMPPEQLTGEDGGFTPLGDIYSLGVTLYELLTFHSPFESKSGEGMRNRILQGKARPLGELNAAVGGDAATVCSKAMDVDPARRYAEATDLARDLRNVLELRPIEASPPGLFLRARRWSQRRPALATGMLLGVLLLIAGPLLYALVQERTARRIQAAFDVARKERDRAEESLRATLDAVESMLVPMAQPPFANLPQIDPQRQQILERAVAIYRRLLAQKPREPLVRSATAKGLVRLGKIYRQVGKLDAAESCYREAGDACADLAAAEPHTPDHRWLLAEARADLARVLIIRGAFEEARREFEGAIAILDGIVEQHPQKLTYQHDLAAYLMNLASLFAMGERLSEALPLIRRAVAILNVLVERSNRAPQNVQGLCSALFNLAQFEMKSGALAAAREQLGRVRELQEEVLAAVPGRPASLAVLANIEITLGRIAGQEGRTARIAAHYAKAIELLDGLVRDFPARADYLRTLVRCHMELAEASANAGDDDAARHHAEQAIERSAALVALRAGIASDTFLLARAHGLIARCWNQAGDETSAREHWSKGEELLRDLPSSAERDDTRARILLARANAALARRRSGWSQMQMGTLLAFNALRSEPEQAAYRQTAVKAVRILVEALLVQLWPRG